MILLRHGESEFNAAFTRTRRDPGIRDPVLTALGQAQAAAAAAALAGAGIARIVVSPFTRALQTAAPVAAALRVPVLVSPMVRERFAFTCDIGTPRSQLAQAWPDHDFAHLDEIWWPDGHEEEAAAERRASLFRAEMAATGDWRTTLVVSHWGFILALTGRSVMNGQHIDCDPTAPGPEQVVWQVV